MKQLIILIFSLAANSIYGQQANTANRHSKNKANTVTFIVKFDKTKATKDGYYLAGYIVDIDPKQAKKLDGKKIKITGKVFIVKGLSNELREYDKNGKPVIKQGREEDTKHILSPVIEIVDK